MLSTVVLAILGLMVLGIWTADVYGIDDIPVDSAISINISGKQILVDKKKIKILLEKKTPESEYDEQIVEMREKSTGYWLQQSNELLRQRLHKTQNTNQAKNIIYFVGDGMSSTTITATRIFQGQLNGRRGEENVLSFEKFPNLALSKTYCLDLQVADSACSATAYLGGVKANMFTMGVNGNVKKDECKYSNNPLNHVNSLLRWAQLAGKSTGIITNTRLTHATPASAYTHSSNRLHECDADIHKLNGDEENCIDSARQFIEYETGQNLNVALGGGTTKFLPNITIDAFGRRGSRLDNRNLINEWNNQKKNMSKIAAYVNTRDELLAIDNDKTDFLLGLFASSHMGFHADANQTVEPSLYEMTEAALKVLSKNTNGYVLFVESGLIDFANHFTRAQQALIETAVLAKTVEMTEAATNESDTLIVVTSDHSHTMTISGYPERGHNILGTVDNIDEGTDPEKINKKRDLTILSYAYGPGYVNNRHTNGTIVDLDNVTIDKDFQYLTAAYSNDEAHGGDDVSIYSRGPFGHLLSGVVEQSYIPRVINYAACMGPSIFKTRCDDQKNYVEN